MLGGDYSSELMIIEENKQKKKSHLTLPFDLVLSLLYYLSFLLTPANPIRTTPRSSMVVGSGIVINVKCFTVRLQSLFLATFPHIISTKNPPRYSC
jgi:hypothetical protein